MAIAIVAMILGAVTGEAGTLDRPGAGASLKRAWASVASAPASATVPDPVTTGREADVPGRAATAGATASPAKAVTLAVATTLFGAWTLARAVARRVA